MGFQEKELEKEGKYTDKLKKKKRTDKGWLLTLRLKAIQIKSQRKTFDKERIPESRCTRKETFDIDIFIKSKNNDRNIMQLIRIMGRPPIRIRKRNQFSQL